MIWLWLGLAKAEEKVLIDDLRTAEEVTYSEETLYRQGLQNAMTNRLSKKYRLIGDHNFIPEMEKTDSSFECLNANCSMNMAKVMEADWLVTSDWTGGYLTVTLLDVKANRPVCSDMRGPEGRSLLLTYEPDPIIDCLNKRAAWLPQVRLPDLPEVWVEPPSAERVRDVALAVAVAGPILYMFIDNFSNIAEK
jgi:hypothetical protein